MEERFYRSVELGFLVLRRVDHVGVGWTQCPAGLRRELNDWLGRCGPGLFELDAIVDPPLFGHRATEELVEHVLTLVETGQVEVDWRTFGHSDMQAAPPEPMMISANDAAPVPVEPPVAAEPDSLQPETEATRAQVQAMLVAAQRGTPFCEVCELFSPPRAAEREAAATEAAQVAALTRAASEGTAFCEECVATA